jgi:hypothetical protein
MYNCPSRCCQKKTCFLAIVSSVAAKTGEKLAEREGVFVYSKENKRQGYSSQPQKTVLTLGKSWSIQETSWLSLMLLLGATRYVFLSLIKVTVHLKLKHYTITR